MNGDNTFLPRAGELCKDWHSIFDCFFEMKNLNGAKSRNIIYNTLHYGHKAYTDLS